MRIGILIPTRGDDQRVQLERFTKEVLPAFRS